MLRMPVKETTVNHGIQLQEINITNEIEKTYEREHRHINQKETRFIILNRT